MCAYVCIWVCGVKTRDGWCSLLMSHIFRQDSFSPTLLCFSVPSCRCCCFYAHPAAVKWNGVTVCKHCASAESKQWSMIQTGLSILSEGKYIAFTMLPASAELRLRGQTHSWSDPAASYDVQLGWCTVYTSDLSWSLLTNLIMPELSTKAGEMESRAKHPNKVNSQACIIYYSTNSNSSCLKKKKKKGVAIVVVLLVFYRCFKKVTEETLPWYSFLPVRISNRPYILQ